VPTVHGLGGGLDVALDSDVAASGGGHQLIRNFDHRMNCDTKKGDAIKSREKFTSAASTIINLGLVRALLILNFAKFFCCALFYYKAAWVVDTNEGAACSALQLHPCI